jgi:hypothetical protein
MTAVGRIISRRKACSGAQLVGQMAQAHKSKLRRQPSAGLTLADLTKIRLAQLRT